MTTSRKVKLDARKPLALPSEMVCSYVDLALPSLSSEVCGSSSAGCALVVEMMLSSKMRRMGWKMAVAHESVRQGRYTNTKPPSLRKPPSQGKLHFISIIFERAANRFRTGFERFLLTPTGLNVDADGFKRVK